MSEKEVSTQRNLEVKLSELVLQDDPPLVLASNSNKTKALCYQV